MKFFDAHLHIIDPKYPLVENNGYLPPYFAVEDYKHRLAKYEILGGALVSGSFQAFDQTYLLNALPKLGSGFVGVANIPMGMSQKDLTVLEESGVVAVRFNLKRGGDISVDKMIHLANVLFDTYGWHTELYVDSQDLKSLTKVLNNIPQLSIDHLGLSKSGLPVLYRWVEKGVKVKATGFGRIDFEPIPVMKKIYDINPNSLLFGSDLPSTRARVPFSEADIALVQRNFTEQEQDNIFNRNAKDWYLKNKDTASK